MGIESFSNSFEVPNTDVRAGHLSRGQYLPQYGAEVALVMQWGNDEIKLELSNGEVVGPIGKDENVKVGSRSADA